MPAAAPLYDVVALGNALVDVIAPADEDFLRDNQLTKGAMGLVEEAQAVALYGRMAAAMETSGGSAANTIAGVLSLGGRGAYVGKVGADALGATFTHDMRASGATFDVAPLTEGPATGRSMIAVTPDGQRTMTTYLGASSLLRAEDVEAGLIGSAAVVYLEGYLFDSEPARAAFATAARAARAAGRTMALTLSDGFVVGRWRDELLDFMPQIDLLFANEDEVMALTGAAAFEDAAVEVARLAPIVAITRGPEGSVVLSHGEAVAVPADAVACVVDTTGAGDQFAAGFLFGLARGRSLRQCAELGALAASEVIGHYGPRPLVSLEAMARARALI